MYHPPPIKVTPSDRITCSRSRQNLQEPPFIVTKNHVTTANTNNGVSDVNSLAISSRLYTNSEEGTRSSLDEMMTNLTWVRLQYKKTIL